MSNRKRLARCLNAQVLAYRKPHTYHRTVVRVRFYINPRKWKDRR